jgi:hypothetical protein
MKITMGKRSWINIGLNLNPITHKI